MKTALIFPGQGSQFVGMGEDFYSNFQSSRDIYDQLDEIMGKSMTNLMFNGEESELAMTVNAQPSIMATSIAILSSLMIEGKLNEHTFHCVGGHSLGEYSALVLLSCVHRADCVLSSSGRSLSPETSVIQSSSEISNWSSLVKKL